jgi:hypothetical protein
MSDYARSTTSATLASLPEPIRGAIKAKAEALLLTVADDAPAFLTHSTRLKKRLFGGDPDKEHQTALVIGAKDVLVATHGEKRGTAVLHTRLEAATVSQFSIGAISADDGMSVGGFPHSGPDGGSSASFYVGLGAPDGPAARAALSEAIRAAKA